MRSRKAMLPGLCKNSPFKLESYSIRKRRKAWDKEQKANESSNVYYQNRLLASAKRKRKKADEHDRNKYHSA